MRYVETVKLAFSAILAHKLRSVLTLLGMIIGVTSVVVVVSLIQGFNHYIDEKVAGIGSKTFSVFRYDFIADFRDIDTLNAAQRRNKDLTLEDFRYLCVHATHIDQLAAKAFPTNSQIKRAAETLDDVPVDGATANVAQIENREIADGRFFTAAENESAARVAFIGADIASKFFPSDSAVNRELSIRGLPYRVIGVAAAQGTVFGIPQDTFITLPLKTYTKDFGSLNDQRGLYFVGTAPSDALFADAVDEARQLMRARRHLRANDKDNFGIITPDIITGLRDRIFGAVSLVAIAVPSIALVISGIVIMNIMLVSVTERTREIGIRKAVGARPTDILQQFLVEAVALSSVGGAIGVLIAWLLGTILTALFFPTYLSIAAVVTAVAVSGVVGVLAGIAPAWKAARLDPIEALRAE